MSGGSHNYIYANLAHDLEWAESCDKTMEEYRDTVKRFKSKWFKQDRETRVKGYIDTKCEELKEELYRLLE